MVNTGTRVNQSKQGKVRRMHDQPSDPSASGCQTVPEWRSRLAEIGDERGYFQPLGSNHSALFIDEGPTLIVTFETVDGIRDASESQMPLGYRVAEGLGWSHLCLIAEGETWFRDPAVYRFFDRLVDDAFFEDFDQVVFYGAGMCGYAATAYCVTAPGATVLAIQPLATLDPRVTEWDARYTRRRRLNFTDRYGYAPDMIEGAGDVYVLYDPEEPLDAMHAALFTKPFVTKLRCPHLGGQIEQSLLQMDVLPRLLARAGAGRLDSATFHRLYRARRNHGGYLRGLLARLQDDDRPLLSAYVCRSALSRIAAPRIRRRLEQVEAELTARGTPLRPAPPRTDAAAAEPAAKAAAEK